MSESIRISKMTDENAEILYQNRYKYMIINIFKLIIRIIYVLTINKILKI